MKFVLTFILMLLAVLVNAQKTEQYFDYQWKPCEPQDARFYTVIQKKDSLWWRQDYYIRESSLQMDGTYLDQETNIAHGNFRYFHPNKMLESTGRMTNGKKDGTWLFYYNDGSLKDSIPYTKGMIIGTRLSFHKNGFLSDSIIIDHMGNGISYSWFENGIPSAAGRLGNGAKPDGTWQFFDRDGKKSAIETYQGGKLLTKQYFDKEGNSADTAGRDHDAEFKGGLRAWGKYLAGRVSLPPNSTITGSGKAAIVVEFDIDETGRIINATVTTPFHPDVDKTALKAVANAPSWTPAVEHNRPIRTHHTQPIHLWQQ